jgi:hypothetical protein
MAVLRKHPDPEIANKFINAEATENLLISLNDAFDVMNARIPKNGINKKNWPEKRKVRLFINK